MLARVLLPPERALSRRPAVTHERVLAALLVAEILVFAAVGRRFLTADNLLEIVRVSADVGLLALALTPVIVAGGIDLSVGSLMGLSAVLFGALWRDAGMPIAVAGLLAVVAGAAGGALNAVLVTRLRLPALIVTLGTLSLFRGLCEGLTGGVANYTNFPDGFLFLGQGYVAGIPAQLPVFAAAAAGFWLLLHRTTAGRALQAVGYSPEAARHAGIPVDRRVATTYVLAGTAAGVAALLYVARSGQAKADAGLGYELTAITAVVLGGTSIFGGRGTVHGTLLGVFVLAVLSRGLTLADQPRELAGILTGALLVGSIVAHRWLGGRQVKG